MLREARDTFAVARHAGAPPLPRREARLLRHIGVAKGTRRARHARSVASGYA